MSIQTILMKTENISSFKEEIDTDMLPEDQNIEDIPEEEKYIFVPTNFDQTIMDFIESVSEDNCTVTSMQITVTDQNIIAIIQYEPNELLQKKRIDNLNNLKVPHIL